jgi:hypothetical protein
LLNIKKKIYKTFFKKPVNSSFNLNADLLKFLIKKQMLKFQKFIKICKILFYQCWIIPKIYYIKKILLKNLISLLNFKKINIIFIIQNLKYLSSFILSNFIKKKLIAGYPINAIIYPLIDAINHLIRKRRLLGLKIVLSGRLRRRGRAQYIWKQIGWIRKGCKNNWVDYDLSIYKSKFSLFGIKIWLLLNKIKSTKIQTYI